MAATDSRSGRYRSSLAAPTAGSMRPLTILFICTGNTCRSPLAAALARQVATGEGVRFLSAGLEALPGVPASPGSVAAAGEMGADLQEHRSQALTGALLAEADWVIGMTRTHIALLKQRFPEFRGKIGLLGEPGADLSHRATPEAMQIDDPFGSAFQEYRDLAEQLVGLLRAWRPVFEAGTGSADDAEDLDTRSTEEAS